MPGIIKVYPNRLKSINLSWLQGSSLVSPPVDLTNATCTVLSHNFIAAPTTQIIDAVNGLCELTFSAASTKGLQGLKQVTVALTFTTAPDYSPDPVVITVQVG